MDKAELKELAYDDPLAALMMGVRFSEDWKVHPIMNPDPDYHDQMAKERIDWYLRAAALSGKTGPLMRVANYYRHSEGELPPSQYGVGIGPSQMSAVLVIAELLGDERANSAEAIDQQYQDLKLSWGDHEQYDELVKNVPDEIDYYFQEYMSYMDSVQREVTGDVQINKFQMNGGDSDA